MGVVFFVFGWVEIVMNDELRYGDEIVGVGVRDGFLGRLVETQTAIGKTGGIREQRLGRNYGRILDLIS